MEKRANEVLNLIASLDSETQSYLNAYLKNVSISILEEFDIVSMKGGTTFIYEGTDVQKIFILVEGRVKATDQYLDGVNYEYMWFKPIKVFGVMELLLELKCYKSTLTTTMDSRFLVLSRSVYEKWLDYDDNMLRIEARNMGAYLLAQAKMARAFLFLEGKQRVLVFIMSTMNLNGEANAMHLSRQKIADNTGLSVRTVNRVIKELTAKGYFCCQGMKILANKEQKERMEQETAGYWHGLENWNRLL